MFHRDNTIAQTLDKSNLEILHNKHDNNDLLMALNH